MNTFYYCITGFCHNKGSRLHVPEKNTLSELQDVYVRDRKSVGHTRMSRILEPKLEVWT